MGELAPLHPHNNTFPGEVFLDVAADALDWCGASRADPLALDGMRDRFLAECAFRGQQNKKLQFAVLTAAALGGGADSVQLRRSSGRVGVWKLRNSSSMSPTRPGRRPFTVMSWLPSLCWMCRA